MKTVKINFTDIPAQVDKNNNFITRALRKRYDVQICDDPDYLIFGSFKRNNLYFDGIKIFYTGEDCTPDFNICDYAIAFDDLQFGDRYLRYPIFAIRHSFAPAKQKHLFTEEDLSIKTGFCNFIYSNSWLASPKRKEFFELLSQYKQVDSGGLYLNNIGGPIGKSIDDKLDFQSHYKFSIAFENGQSESYTTEKIVDAFAAKTIPIYWGNPSIAKDFNAKAFINCNDFDSFEAVVERVKEIDNDDELYRAMLSEPIFTPENHPERFSEERLEEFLYHIFDQPLDKAFRRSYHTRREVYAKECAKYYRCYQKKNPEHNIFVRAWIRVYSALCPIKNKLFSKS